MTDEWEDADDPILRDLFRYQLRAHVRYQDGRDSLAPALVFADADYEVGDGTCGLHSDGKQANEPAIVYVRADTLIDANTHALALVAEAYGVAAKVCHDMHDDGLYGDTLTSEEAAVAHECGDEINARTPADAIAARGARDAEVWNEAIEAAATAAEQAGHDCVEAILALIEKGQDQ